VQKIEGGESDQGNPDADAAPRVRAKRPWWFPHFLGRVPLGLEQKDLTLVGVVSLSMFFESYDLSMLTAALKQIRETFDLGSSEMSSLVAYVRLGAIPAFLVLPLADRLGRRRVYLWALVGMSLGTFLTAFARTPIEFVAVQTLTRVFVVASIAAAVVIVAEELPAEHRGWGIGMLGAIGSFGYGLGAILYAFVEELPYGWRSLYVVGVAPCLFYPYLRRRVPETKRFLLMREAGTEGQGGWARPMIDLVVAYPWRSATVGLMAFVVAAGMSPAFGLLSDFVQTSHGWKPSSYSLMALVAGVFGIAGNTAMGWSADRWGRRPIGVFVFITFPLFALALYFGPGMAIPLFWVPMVFMLTGGNVLMRMVTTELFPTGSRNTAMGWETLMETVGAAAGYALVGVVAAGAASIAPAVAIVSALTILGAIVVWTFPETAKRELESTSDDATQGAS
jgi:MFS family permease